MQSRFRISSLLLFTLFIALVAWCLVVQSAEQFLLRLFLSSFVIGVAFALRSRQTRPLRSAAVSGALFIASCVFIGTITESIGYLFHTEAYPYYEEGFFQSYICFFPLSFAFFIAPRQPWSQFCRVGSQLNVSMRGRPTKVTPCRAYIDSKSLCRGF